MQVTVRQNKSLGNYESLTIELTAHSGDEGMEPTTLAYALRAVIAEQFDRAGVAAELLTKAYREEERIGRNVSGEFERLNATNAHANGVVARRADQMRMSLIALGFAPALLNEAELLVKTED